MVRRILLLVVVAAALLGMIVYSQMKRSPPCVSGTLESEEIRLGSRVGGRVLSVHVAEGDTVAKGAALVEFEPFDLLEREQQAAAVVAESEAALMKFSRGLREEEIAQAKVRLDRAAAELSLVRAGPRAGEIAAAESRLSAASAGFQLARRENERIVGLFQSNAVPKSEFDQASERLEAASAELEVRTQELQILQSGSRSQEIAIAESVEEDARLAWELAKKGYRAEETSQAAAARDAARASLAAIRKQMEELVVRAPSAGTIDALDLQPGDLVPPNAPVLSMLPEGPLSVRAYVPQGFLKLSVGQTVRVSVDSFPGTEFQGRITFISGRAEFTPGNVQTPDDRARQAYRIRVQLEGQHRDLHPGMTANVWLEPMQATR